ETLVPLLAQIDFKCEIRLFVPLDITLDSPLEKLILRSKSKFLRKVSHICLTYSKYIKEFDHLRARYGPDTFSLIAKYFVQLNRFQLEYIDAVSSITKKIM